MPTVLVGDDTDLLILLLYHVDLNSKDVYFIPEPKGTSTKSRKWDIKTCKTKLGLEICSNLLFVHAVLGCDTTSRLYGIGKAAGLTKIQNNDDFQNIARVFLQDGVSKNDVIEAGERALVILYGGDKGVGLDSLRYKRFQEKVVRSLKQVEANTLPPTSGAAKFHSLRVYYQVQEWRGKSELMKADDWGWKEVKGQLLPVKTDLPPAPEELLRLFRCNCKTDCDTKKCTCKKHYLECNAACGHCKGVSCFNSQKMLLQDDEDNETIDDK